MIISINVMIIIIMYIYADNSNKGISSVTMALSKNPIIIAALIDMVAAIVRNSVILCDKIVF